jgi:hypothetical protein
MPANPFGFLLELPEAEGKEWLRRYLRGDAIEPPVRVPFDLQPLEFLLGQVNPLPEEALPLRVGTLAGTLLAEAIIRGAHRGGDRREIEALFTLVESLPVSDAVAEFLNDLAVTGRLLSGPGECGIDFHLLALRGLILHQRPVHGEVSRLIQFWKNEMHDLRYAAVAIQGLLRVSVTAAIEVLPDFVRRARVARPPVPLANTLFAVSVELGTDRALWEQLVRAFRGWPDELEVVRETFGKARLPESNPAAWEVLATRSSEPEP